MLITIYYETKKQLNCLPKTNVEMNKFINEFYDKIYDDKVFLLNLPTFITEDNVSNCASFVDYAISLSTWDRVKELQVLTGLPYTVILLNALIWNKSKFYYPLDKAVVISWLRIEEGAKEKLIMA